MYLPIAVLHSDVGIAKAVRYYVFDEAIKANYNDYIQEYLPTSTVQQGRIVDVPIEMMPRVYQCVSESRRGWFNTVRSHTFILLGDLAGVTNIDSEGNKVNDYTQLIAPKNVKSYVDNTIYAVDFKGNVAALTDIQVLDLIRSDKLTIGNPDTLDLLCKQTKAAANRKEICKGFTGYSGNALLDPYDNRLNKYRADLDALYTMQGLGSKTQVVSEDFTMDCVAGTGSTLIIPRGIVTIDLDTDSRPHRLKTIVCPSEVTSMRYIDDNNNLERFICPQIITAGFILHSSSIDNLVLPKRVLGLDCPNQAATFELFLQSFSSEILHFTSGTRMNEIDITKAPRLKRFDATILPCKPFPGHKSPEVIMYITLADAPVLEEIKISPQKSVLGDTLHNLHSLVITAAASEYKISCELPVNALKLCIPTLNECTITIQHCGIGRLNYESHTEDVTLNIKGGEPKDMTIAQDAPALWKSRYYAPAQINYL